MNLSSLIPLAIVALVVYLLHRHSGMRLWHAIVCLVLGVVLASTFLGADLTTFLSQITGGRLP